MNHYEILGVGPDATEQQIKEAYRREAMKWHPDRHDGAAAKGEADRRFKDLAVAYSTLRNPVDRANYDRQLDQKLRQEYEARQQQQARQQRAQSEQAKQNQTRQEPPRRDFEETGPQFEEQTASNDDANQMFYEQMLDLAFELAGRGFPEFNIFKALLALGCPEALAKRVAAAAAKQPKQTSSKSANFWQPEANGRDDQADALPAIQDYYKAAIGPANQDFYLRKFKKFDQSGSAGFSWPSPGQFFAGVFWLFYRRMPLSAWLYIGSPFVLLFFIYMLFGSDIKDDSLPMSVYNIITAVAYWLFLPARMNAMYYNSTHKNILAAKAKSSDRVSQLAILRKGGGTNSSIRWLLVTLILGGILAAVALPAYQDYTRRAQVATGFAVGSEATQKVGVYYAAQKKGPGDLAATGFSFAPSKTVKEISFDGQTGVLTINFQDGFFDSKSLLLVPTAVDNKLTWSCTSTGIPSQYLPQACKATQQDANARLATINADAPSRDQAKSDYAQILTAIEGRHPELNPDSPRYNVTALDWVAARKALHQERGQTPTNSLQLAVADYVASQKQTGQSVSTSMGTPPLDNYLAGLRSLSMKDRHFQMLADMGSKFPVVSGTLTNVTKDFRQQYAQQARLIEESQGWGISSKNGSRFGFIVLQNRTAGTLKGVVLEVQAEERPCDNKGNVYYMSLAFNTTLAPGSVTGINFTVPPEISNGNRCIDVVDLIPG